MDDRPVPAVALQIQAPTQPAEGAFKTKHCTRLLWSLMQVNCRYVDFTYVHMCDAYCVA